MIVSTSKEGFRLIVENSNKVGRLRCDCGARVWVNPTSTWLRDSFIDEHWPHGSMNFETEPLNATEGNSK